MLRSRRRAFASLRFEALGSECELYALAPAAELEATRAWVLALHRRLSRFEPTSELSRLNARAGSWTTVSPELGALLREAIAAFELSGGLVNAAILPALCAAGYDRTFAEITGRGQAHDEPVPPLPDVLDVQADQARLRPGAALDLGGIAKGWIADRACERLGADALANMGGDLRARGEGPSGMGWPVGFGGRTLLLADDGAATSGTARRRWGPGLHHVIDPRSGAPAVTDLEEVSVVAGSAVDAEVLAKTALILGSAAAPSALRGARAWALR